MKYFCWLSSLSYFVTRRSCGPGREEGSEWSIGSRSRKGERVLIRKTVKIYVGTIILKTDYRMICTLLWVCITIVFIDKFRCNEWRVQRLVFIFGGERGNGRFTKWFSFTVISNLRVKLCWVRTWILFYCITLWILCLYCSLLSAQLCSRLLSSSWPKRREGARKEFQSEHRGVFVLRSSPFLSVYWLGFFVGKVADGVWPVTEGVDGSNRVSGSDKEVSDEMSIGSLT